MTTHTGGPAGRTELGLRLHGAELLAVLTSTTSTYKFLQGPDGTNRSA